MNNYKLFILMENRFQIIIIIVIIIIEKSFYFKLILFYSQHSRASFKRYTGQNWPTGHMLCIPDLDFAFDFCVGGFSFVTQVSSLLKDLKRFRVFVWRLFLIVEVIIGVFLSFFLSFFFSFLFLAFRLILLITFSLEIFMPCTLQCLKIMK